MVRVELKVARIGNSRGVRLPAPTLERYRIGATVVMEERSDGILLRPAGHSDTKLSWDETASEMAASSENWDAWDTTSSDGLDEYVWPADPPRRVAESKTGATRPRKGRSR